MNGPTSSPRRRRERGEITWVGALLLLLVLGGAYLAYMWGPVYYLHFEVKQATRATINDGVRERDDRVLAATLCSRLAALAHGEELDAQGRVSRVPLVDVRPEDVTWERDTRASPPRLRAAFAYVRAVRYPWTARFAEKTFAVDITQDIDVPRW
jgi:hypothetical protein